LPAYGTVFCVGRFSTNAGHEANQAGWAKRSEPNGCGADVGHGLSAFAQPTIEHHQKQSAVHDAGSRRAARSAK